MTFREASVIKQKLHQKQLRLDVVNLQIRKHRSPGKYKEEAKLIIEEIEKLQTLLNQ